MKSTDNKQVEKTNKASLVAKKLFNIVCEDSKNV